MVNVEQMKREYNEVLAQKCEPIAIIADVKFKDDDEVLRRQAFSLIDFIDDTYDDYIFYYLNSFEEFLNLCQEDNGEDFDVVNFIEFVVRGEDLCDSVR